MTDFDRLIDDAARGITAHEPPAHLRTRVLARLDERRASRRIWLFVPIAAATMAAVALVLVINRSSRLPETAPLAPLSTALVGETPGRLEIPAGAADPHAARPSVAVAGPRAVAANDAAAWREELMPSLPAIAALGITEIQPDTLAIPQLTVKPLVIAPIDNGNQR